MVIGLHKYCYIVIVLHNYSYTVMMLQYCGYTGLLMCYTIINHSLPLLSSTQVHDQPPLAGQVQELDQKVTPLIDLLI